jgi:hypothetical protein
VSDYLTNLAAKSINQSHGFRFLAGELRPRLASRFEPPDASIAAWPESPAQFSRGLEQEPPEPGTSPYLPAVEINVAEGKQRIRPAVEIDLAEGEQLIRPALQIHRSHGTYPDPLRTVQYSSEPADAMTNTPVEPSKAGLTLSPAPEALIATNDSRLDSIGDVTPYRVTSSHHVDRQEAPTRQDEERRPTGELSPMSLAPAALAGEATAERHPGLRLPDSQIPPGVTARTVRQTVQPTPEAVIDPERVERVAERERGVRSKPAERAMPGREPIEQDERQLESQPVAETAGWQAPDARQFPAALAREPAAASAALPVKQAGALQQFEMTRLASAPLHLPSAVPAGETQQPDDNPSTHSPAQPLSLAAAARQVERALEGHGVLPQAPAPSDRRVSPAVARGDRHEPRDEANTGVETPVINVTIGRVEVRAVPAAVAASRPRAAPKVMTLEDYVRRRNAGGGS